MPNSAMQSDLCDVPPTYDQYLNPAFSREEKYRNIIQKYGISEEYSHILQRLRDFKIVFIFDDSGSMNSILQTSPLNNFNRNNILKATRWDEFNNFSKRLQYFASIMIEIGSFFNDETNSDTDIYFLNQPPIKKIASVDSLMNELKNVKPHGITPLNNIFKLVLQDNEYSIQERNLLVIILTDGKESDKSDLKAFKQTLKSKASNVFVNFITCTDDSESIRYLYKWDKQIPNLDVTDDYDTEKDQVKKAKGKTYKFSFGDYVVKSMMGSIEPTLDLINETKCLIL